MATTFYFYDLETTGANTRNSRIMQFAGQRTDKDLKPIGKPDNFLVKLSDDILPDPRAVMVHKITPQEANAEGISELELCRYLFKEVFTPDTIICGFNNIRFDDEILRFTFWRNFIDPYEWAYKQKRSRWDVIDLARMTRALRPEGVTWPVLNGKPTNKLEELAKANGLIHDNAHDALSDVTATIELAQLIKTHQPKLFEHYLSLRDKSIVSSLVASNDMLVHTSGMLSSSHEKTTIVAPIGVHPTNPNMILVYDLRYDPSEFSDLGEEEIFTRIFTPSVELRKQKLNRLPIKGISINKSPAIAPLGVLDEQTWEKIGLSEQLVNKHRVQLQRQSDFIRNVTKAHTASEFDKASSAEEALYEGFVASGDKAIMQNLDVLNSDSGFTREPEFADARLRELWFSFVARNALDQLSEEKQQKWRETVRSRHESKASSYSRILQAIASDERYLDDDKTQFLLEELHLYIQSLGEHDY